MQHGRSRAAVHHHSAVPHPGHAAVVDALAPLAVGSVFAAVSQDGPRVALPRSLLPAPPRQARRCGPIWAPASKNPLNPVPIRPLQFPNWRETCPRLCCGCVCGVTGCVSCRTQTITESRQACCSDGRWQQAILMSPTAWSSGRRKWRCWQRSSTTLPKMMLPKIMLPNQPHPRIRTSLPRLDTVAGANSSK